MLDKEMLKLMGSVDVKGAGACPTVRIKSPEAPGGCVEINEADFDPETMTLFKD